METRLGGPVGLVITGLVLALAVQDRLPGIDLPLVGWILTGAGAVWLVLAFSLARPRPLVVRREATPVEVSGRVLEPGWHDTRF